MALLRTVDRRRNGALLGVAGALLLSVVGAPDAHAYVVKKTSRGALVHWDTPTVDYTFDPSIGENVPDAVSATSHALLSWSGTVGAPELQGHEATTAVTPPKSPGFDQKNGVFFMPNGYAPAGKALAVTVLTYDNASGRILDADIIVNGIYKFAVLEDVSDAAHALKDPSGPHPTNTDGIAHQDEATSIDTVYDLHHVVAHELGHSLGMNDEMQRKDALMYRYSAPNDATLRAPASDDIAGLAELYSTKLEASGNGCGNATVAPKKPSLAASHFAMAATLGFLFFLVLRGRSDRRARLAFVAAAAVAAYAMLPTISKTDGGGRRCSRQRPRARPRTRQGARHVDLDGSWPPQDHLPARDHRLPRCQLPEARRGLGLGRHRRRHPPGGGRPARAAQRRRCRRLVHGAAQRTGAALLAARRGARGARPRARDHARERLVQLK